MPSFFCAQRRSIFPEAQTENHEDGLRIPIRYPADTELLFSGVTLPFVWWAQKKRPFGAPHFAFSRRGCELQYPGRLTRYQASFKNFLARSTCA